MSSLSIPTYLRFLLVPLALLATITLFGKQVPPKSSTLVTDYTNTLTLQETRNLERKLVNYNRETSTQIAVVLENSVGEDDIFDYSNRLARAWGIGGGENDNGVLIYVAVQDRDLRIQTGYGVEAFLTDALSRRIIENILVPAFRQGQYYTGLDRATDTIMELGKGEYQGKELDERQEAEGGIPFFLIVMVIVFLVVMLSRNSGGDDDDDGGYYRGGRYDTQPRRRRRGGGWMIFPFPMGGGGFGGGGFGGGGGGGFGGFGGGDFGGGGAGGSW